MGVTFLSRQVCIWAIILMYPLFSIKEAYGFFLFLSTGRNFSFPFFLAVGFYPCRWSPYVLFHPSARSTAFSLTHMISSSLVDHSSLCVLEDIWEVHTEKEENSEWNASKTTSISQLLVILPKQQCLSFSRFAHATFGASKLHKWKRPMKLLDSALSWSSNSALIVLIESLTSSNSGMNQWILVAIEDLM